MHDSGALARALDIAEPVARILCARGLSEPSAALDFLAPPLSGLHDPLLMRDMDRALDRLLLAIRRGEAIQIHGDYDVDGTTSTVILKTAIEMAGGSATFSIPHRLKDGYGMREAAMDRAAAAGVSLIVSVDTGIRAMAAVERARALGIDVIVTDHHLPESELPRALAILNPNRPDCLYPEKQLCGAGVTFKLAQALLGTLGWPQPKLDRILASFLKMVAIATVADVVPLTGENRIIVWHGLRGLAAVRNAGLRALLDAAGVAPGKIPSVSQVGFRLAPRINAAGRMACADEVVELFLTADVERARDIAARLSALNSERQEAEARITAACEEAAIDTSACALVFCEENWHRGVLGIVASRLAERFCRPVFVLGSENGETSGSGRSIAAFHLLASLESMRHLFTRFGGHKQAAGVTLETSRVGEFRAALAAFAAANLTAEDLTPKQRIDGCIRLSDLNADFWKDLSRLAPFGMGNPAPVFAACGVQVLSDAAPMKEKHLRFNALQDGRSVSFKAFHCAHRRAELTRGACIDVAFHLENDDYNGGWCAKVCDFRPTAK